MRNFALLNAYTNKAEALKAWKKLSSELEATGYKDLVQLHQPHDDADFRQIVQCIATLTEASEVARRNIGGFKPFCPVCSSSDINQYMMPYGPMWCMECGCRVEEKNDQPNPFLESVSTTGKTSPKVENRDE